MPKLPVRTAVLALALGVAEPGLAAPVACATDAAALSTHMDEKRAHALLLTDQVDALGKLFFREMPEGAAAEGKAITLDMINIAKRKGAGKLDDVWRNPTTGKPESKHSYFRTVDGRLVGMGYFTR